MYWESALYRVHCQAVCKEASSPWKLHGWDLLLLPFLLDKKHGAQRNQASSKFRMWTLWGIKHMIFPLHYSRHKQAEENSGNNPKTYQLLTQLRFLTSHFSNQKCLLNLGMEREWGRKRGREGGRGNLPNSADIMDKMIKYTHIQIRKTIFPWAPSILYQRRK